MNLLIYCGTFLTRRLQRGAFVWGMRPGIFASANKNSDLPRLRLKSRHNNNALRRVCVGRRIASRSVYLN